MGGKVVTGSRKPRKAKKPRARPKKAKAPAVVTPSGREVWAVVSDLHCGSTLGLCPPGGIALDDGGRYLPSEAQLKLWDCWRDYWTAVEKTLRPGDRLIALVNGDAVDGDHHKTAQIISKNLAATQQSIAMECLIPMLALEPAAKILIRGTEAHVGSSAEFEERLAYTIGCEPDPKSGAYSHWHLKALSQDVLLDFGHHGRLGMRKWTKMTGPTTMVCEIIMSAAERGERIPDLVVRSHRHKKADTGTNYAARLIQTPCFQLSTAFGHKIAVGDRPDIGGRIVICEAGRYRVEEIDFKWPSEKPWQLSA